MAYGGSPLDSSSPPEGLASSDWSGIRAAYEAGRHAVRRQEDGRVVARNPGQQWHAEFDGKGFTVTPDNGAWLWGLDLTGYGSRTFAVAAPASLPHPEGNKITFQRDENLAEWFINDSRGLEQGWTIRQRPGRGDSGIPLELHLSTRGNVRPQVSTSGKSVTFRQESGSDALTYSGLKAWDANGTALEVRFEQAEGSDFRIEVQDQGARYPITIDPVARQAYLKAGNTDAQDRFGSAVAIDGDTVVIGAFNEGSSATGVNGNEADNSAYKAGAVYVFVRNGTAWTQQAYLKASNTGAEDEFGGAVSISGDTIVVGAQYEDSSSTGVGGDETVNDASQAGAAYVFVRSGTTWTQQAYLKASNTGAQDNFGHAVTIAGDTVVVGAYNEDSEARGINGIQTNDLRADSGAAYVFTRNGTTWTQQAYLKASNSDALDGFAYSLAASGDTLVVGSWQERSSASVINGDETSNTAYQAGAAYVFVRSGTTWTQQAYLKASNNTPQILFGSSVAIDGDTVVVGAPYEYGNLIMEAGAAYIFGRSGTTWSEQAFLKSSTPTSTQQFGNSVAVSGDTVIVGSLRYNIAHVYTRGGTAWTAQAPINTAKPEDIDFFGSAVATSGNTLVLGAPLESSNATGVNGDENDNSSMYAGAAYIFTVTADSSEIEISQAGSNLSSGATKDFGIAVTGSASELTFDLSNQGSGALNLTGTPKVAVTGSSDFTVTEQPSSPIAASGGSTSFKVRFAPTGDGLKSATLTIANNDADEGSFIIQLSGRGLSFTTDTDGDGLSDASEYNMAALNFDWQVSQTALVATYFANANGAGLYTQAQVQALHPGTPLIVRDQASGRFKLTMDWKKSTDLTEFLDFPAPAGSSVSITPAGDIEFEFASPDNAAFFRIETD